jgi:signal peptide peptidase SppA
MCFCSRISSTTIPVIVLEGIISPSSNVSFKKVNELLEQAFKLPFVSHLVLLVNSPGGSPVQCEYIFSRIKSLAAQHNVQVLAFIQDVAASGGYFLACAADEIYASPSSIIGSIGVISSGFGLHKFLEKYGIERRIYAQGDNKALLDPFLPQKDSDVEILNAIGKDVHDSFIFHVKSSRMDKLSDSRNLFTGEVWSGKKAKELGLVDGLGSIHDVLKTKFKDRPFTLKIMKEKKTLFSMLTSSLTMSLSSAIPTLLDSLSNPFT